MTTKTITAFLDNLSKWNTTGTVTPVQKFTEAASLIISHSMATICDRKIAVRVTNTTELLYTINKNIQVPEFSVVTPEQSKFIKPLDTAIPSMIPEGEPDLITYLTQLLRTNTPDQHNNSFWFPTPENPGNTGSYPDSNTNPKRTAWIATERKTEPKRWHWITIGNFRAIYLDRHTAHRNWKTSSWRYSSRVPWHIC